jgi:uncharacterized protein with PIN domain
MVLLGDEAQMEAHFNPFGDMLIMTQDRCTVCGKHTIGSNFVLDAPDVLLGSEAQVEGHFGMFGDSANPDAERCTFCAERIIGSEIVLDAPNGTPR